MHLYFTQMEPPPEDVCARLRAKGWCPGHRPFRRVRFLAPDVDPGEADMLILTSKQAARWYLRLDPLPDLPLAVVGEATASLLPRARLVFDTAPANAAELVARLKPRLRAVTRLLFLRGARASDTVMTGLRDHAPRECIVYETPKIMENRPTPLQPGMVYFQAPGTVVDYMEAYSTPPDRIGAVGPSTAQALHRVGWSVDFQPTRPENICFAAEMPAPSFWQTAPATRRHTR